MKKSVRLKYVFLFIVCTWVISIGAQDTFSIVAVDEKTGEIGSAGASCLDAKSIDGGVVIISDVIPGLGVVHTQSYWDERNQENANLKMKEGLSPKEMIEWLQKNDASDTPQIRQYGIAMLDKDGIPAVAAFTGSECMDVKLQITGINYSIQGNILISNDIIKNMEANFLASEGSLADRLMAAMQGANVAGADSRCLEEGVSSLSSFLRVARKNDKIDDLYIDLVVDETAFGQEPIDRLQRMYDEWKLINNLEGKAVGDDFYITPNPVKSKFVAHWKYYNKDKRTELVIMNQRREITQMVTLTSKKTEIILKKSKVHYGGYIYTLKEDGNVLKQSNFMVINE